MNNLKKRQMELPLDSHKQMLEVFKRADQVVAKFDDLSMVLELLTKLPLFSITRKEGREFVKCFKDGSVPVRRYTVDGFTLSLSPALVPRVTEENKDDAVIPAEPIFPSAIEGLVYSAILSQMKSSIISSGKRLVVSISANKIRSDLKRSGKNVSLNAIREALLVLSGTNVTIKIPGEGNNVLYGRLLELHKEGTVSSTEYPETLDEPDQHVLAVRECLDTIFEVALPPLVSEPVLRGNYRPFALESINRGASPVARWVKQKMITDFTNPSRDYSESYTIMLSQLIRESGFYGGDRELKNIVRDVRFMLKPLVCPKCKSPGPFVPHVCANFLSRFSLLTVKDKEYRGPGRKPTKDVSIILYPSRFFTEQQIKTNTVMKKTGVAWKSRKKF